MARNSALLMDLESQYRASLRMLREAVQKCPADEWNSRRDRDRTWKRALHAMYYAHKYVQVKAGDFTLWNGHSKENRGVPISKNELLEYASFVEGQIADCLRRCDMRAASGFGEYPEASKLEMHIINIRHIQHHAAELYERIGSRRSRGFRWIGHVHGKAR